MDVRRILPTIAMLTAAGTIGCAHHRQNQYAYAPPLAPAVYPQPPVPDALQQPAVSMPVMPAPAPVYAPAGAVPVAMPAVTPTAATVPCDPCQQGMVMPAGGQMVHADGQTPPCPQ
jgi:hypothetical protein